LLAELYTVAQKEVFSLSGPSTCNERLPHNSETRGASASPPGVCGTVCTILHNITHSHERIRHCNVFYLRQTRFRSINEKRRMDPPI
jgi:hypothetical protein